MHERPRITAEPVRLTIRKGPSPMRSQQPPVLPPQKKRKGGFGFGKGILVVLGAILLTTMASKASDSFKLGDTFLLAGSGKSTETLRCPPEMVYVPTSGGGFCIDRYEVSTGVTCPYSKPTSQIQSNEDIVITTCGPVSEKGREPWVNVTLTQAMNLCARVGKRLPSPGEWYRAALGTVDAIPPGKDGCVLGRVGVTQAEQAGAHENCVSSFGAYDMVGNVWEWVDANIVDGTFEGRTLPLEGYVSEADTNGVPVVTSATSSPVFGSDYFFFDPTGARAMIRGGFWNLSDRAGVFTINATVQSSFFGSAVGFRCVK